MGRCRVSSLQTPAGSRSWLATDQPSLTAPLGSPLQAQSSEDLERLSAPPLETQAHGVDGTGFLFGQLKQDTPRPQFGGTLTHSAEATKQRVDY